jgi:hypothetical protein
MSLSFKLGGNKIDVYKSLSRKLNLHWDIRVLICLVVVVSARNHSELHTAAGADAVNAASFSQGGAAFARFSQETFDAHFAIDEVVSETQKGGPLNLD